MPQDRDHPEKTAPSPKEDQDRRAQERPDQNRDRNRSGDDEPMNPDQRQDQRR